MEGVEDDDDGGLEDVEAGDLILNIRILPSGYIEPVARSSGFQGHHAKAYQKDVHENKNKKEQEKDAYFDWPTVFESSPKPISIS